VRMSDTKKNDENQVNFSVVSGKFNKVYQGIQNSNITDNSITYIGQITSHSLDYQELTRRIAEKQEYVELLQATGQTEKALKAAAELEELEQQIEQFKEDVLRLYETFTKIEINTERLVQAKAHFDKGEFREADAILNAADMARDLNRLIERDQQLDKEKADIEDNRTQIASEFLIKARLWATFYDQPNRFEQACEYFEEALRAARTPETVFEYALFLQEHNCFDQAKPLYEEALQIRRSLAEENPHTYLPDVAMTLNNLANLQKDQNDFPRAQENYEEALQIRRALAEENPRTYLPDVAMTLTNFSIFYLKAIPSRENSVAMAMEVLEIYQEFQGIPRLEQYAATAIQVLRANGVDDFQ
jgi:tetratricopeptide (TPR) repeat protein